MSNRPLILDAYSCAGLYADGLEAAGFEVVCLDNDRNALKHNPHETVLGDALALLADTGFTSQFDAIHASPPCQLFSATRKLAEAQGKGQGRAVDLLTPTRALLERLDVPWTIENVERSPLKGRPGVARLCGSSFAGLEVQRHRLFEPSPGLALFGTDCFHASFPIDPERGKPRPWGVYYAKGDSIPGGGRTVRTLEDGYRVMGATRYCDRPSLPWKYLCEGLPPIYGFYIGQQVMAAVRGEVAA